MTFCRCLAETAAHLSDEELERALACAERCALLATRTRREAALLSARCLRLERERRKLAGSRVVAVAQGHHAGASGVAL
jgi:hypothetical protein